MDGISELHIKTWSQPRYEMAPVQYKSTPRKCHQERLEMPCIGSNSYLSSNGFQEESARLNARVQCNLRTFCRAFQRDSNSYACCLPAVGPAPNNQAIRAHAKVSVIGKYEHRLAKSGNLSCPINAEMANPCILYSIPCMSFQPCWLRKL
ncbi:hypothetical protein CEXT_77591 [Caerostris extrusa]|uniref:Uncharacterized protein n=1 Tax=Caerostris extrusa TaxID=172846 RepID=A0AAV4RB11_CAEEX|nr:hypothetical protein CEXT_77591 [Caerostris extrusa]